MQLEQSVKGDIVVLRVHGSVVGAEIGCALSNALGPLLEGGTRKLILDLQSVDWINSTGLGTLIAMLASLRRRNGDMRLAGASTRVVRMLETTRVSDVLQNYDDVSGALASYA